MLDPEMNTIIDDGGMVIDQIANLRLTQLNNFARNNGYRVVDVYRVKAGIIFNTNNVIDLLTYALIFNPNLDMSYNRDRTNEDNIYLNFGIMQYPHLFDCDIIRFLFDYLELLDITDFKYLNDYYDNNTVTYKGYTYQLVHVSIYQPINSHVCLSLVRYKHSIDHDSEEVKSISFNLPHTITSMIFVAKAVYTNKVQHTMLNSSIYGIDVITDHINDAQKVLISYRDYKVAMGLTTTSVFAILYSIDVFVNNIIRYQFLPVNKSNKHDTNFYAVNYFLLSSTPNNYPTIQYFHVKNHAVHVSLDHTPNTPHTELCCVANVDIPIQTFSYTPM